MSIPNKSTVAKFAFAYFLMGAAMFAFPRDADSANLLGRNVSVSPAFEKTVAIARAYNQIVNNGKANYVVVDKVAGYIHVYAGQSNLEIYTARAMVGSTIGDTDGGIVQDYRGYKGRRTTPAGLFSLKYTLVDPAGVSFTKKAGGFTAFGNSGAGIHGADSAGRALQLSDPDARSADYTAKGRRKGTFGCIATLDEDAAIIKKLITTEIPGFVVQPDALAADLPDDFDYSKADVTDSPSTLAVVPDNPRNISILENDLRNARSIYSFCGALSNTRCWRTLKTKQLARFALTIVVVY